MVMKSGGVQIGSVLFPERAVFIDGGWSTIRSAEVIPVSNPATEELISEVIETPPEYLESAFKSARRALKTWSVTPPEVRASYLEALATVMLRSREELARLASSEIGMPISDARSTQVDLPIQVLKSFAELARSHAWEFEDQSGSTIVHEAAGVVLAITPWNFPVHQIVAKVAPALAAGCTVVLKPAELTPLNALAIASMCAEIGLPPGVLNVVTGTGLRAGRSLVALADYDVVSFTGSLAVGRQIGAAAGGAIVRMTLELGGKSPALVLADADLESAVRTTVKNCFVNAGQKCNAPTRLLVPEGSLCDAVNIAKVVADKYVLGDPLLESTTMGPLVSANQRRKVNEYIANATSSGADVARRSADIPSGRGYFVNPAIVSKVDRDAPIVREEVFGPVLVVQGYRSEEDALEMANDSEYGLSAEVWSGDQEKARAVAKHICAGQVRINGARTQMPPVSPFGGYKRSGIGRELGPSGLDEFIEVKAILGARAGWPK